MDVRLDLARRLSYHTHFLREVAQSSARIEVVWNLDDVRRSLRFIAEHGSKADSKVISATANIFGRTADDETRRMCLESLSRIDNPKARNELIKISQSKELTPDLKDLIAAYLANPKRMEDLARSGSKSTTNSTGQR
jgi:predicted type IV restriction endonuclease